MGHTFSWSLHYYTTCTDPGLFSQEYFCVMWSLGCATQVGNPWDSSSPLASASHGSTGRVHHTLLNGLCKSSILRHLCLQDISKVVLHILARITLFPWSTKDAWQSAQVGTSAGKSFPRKCLKAILFWVSWSHHFVWGLEKPYVGVYWKQYNVGCFFLMLELFFLFQFLFVLWWCWL